MHGSAKRLAHDVPQGNIDSTERLNVSAFLSKISAKGIKFFKCPVGCIRRSIDKPRGQNIIDAARHRFRRAILTTFSPPYDSVVGAYTNQQAIAVCEPGLGRVERFIERASQNISLNCLNLQKRTPSGGCADSLGFSCFLGAAHWQLHFRNGPWFLRHLLQVACKGSHRASHAIRCRSRHVETAMGFPRE